jgi:sulfatase maturation enzyme AslB (radical SAM superfamily)
MGEVIYKVPAALIDTYRGCKLIVRADDPRQLLEALQDLNPAELLYVQLLSLPADIELLRQWQIAIAVDLVLSDPVKDFPRLYQYTELLDRRPVRVSLPVVPGFSKAVKLAVALRFAVKLEVTQPELGLIEELAQVLNLYLHQSSAAQPVEYFHSSFLAFYHQHPVTLWTIQEEDPAVFRHITAQGEETLSGRLVGCPVPSAEELETFTEKLLTDSTECHRCEFFAYCGGYFKWPCPEFSCDGVKTLFRTLQGSAAELRRDLAAFAELSAGSPP